MTARTKYHYDSSGERFKIDDFASLKCPKCGTNRLRWNGKWFCVGWADEAARVDCGWSEWKDRSQPQKRIFRESVSAFEADR